MSHTTQNANVRGAAYALTGFAIFSTHDVFIKFLGGFYAPFQIIFFFTLFQFPVITLMLMRDPTDGNLIPKHPWLVLLRTALAVITAACVFYAFSVLPMAQTYAIIFASPLLITLLAIPVLGEQVGWRRSLAIFVGLIGVIVVLNPGTTAFSAGHLAALFGAGCSAGAAVIMRKIGSEERSAVLLLYPMMANFILMGCMMPFVYQPMPLYHLIGTALVAIFGFVAAMFHIMAYRTASAGVVAPMQYSQIIWAVIFGYFFFNETADWNTAVGSVIIIASGVYIVFREETKSVPGKSPVLNTRSRFVPGTMPRISQLSGLIKNGVQAARKNGS